MGEMSYPAVPGAVPGSQRAGPFAALIEVNGSFGAATRLSRVRDPGHDLGWQV